MSLCVRVSVGILSAGSASLPCRAAAIETSTGLEAKTGANSSAALSGKSPRGRTSPLPRHATGPGGGGGGRRREQTDLLPCIDPPSCPPTPLINSHQKNLTRSSLSHRRISTLNHTRRCRHQADFCWCKQWGFPFLTFSSPPLFNLQTVYSDARWKL